MKYVSIFNKNIKCVPKFNNTKCVPFNNIKYVPIFNK